MNGPIYEQSVIVGVDAHKYSHTAAAMDAWGQEKGRLNFTNDSLPDCLSWLKTLGRREDVIVAVEDANSYGCHLVSPLTPHHIPLPPLPCPQASTAAAV